MKQFYLTVGLCLITTAVSAQWLTDMSCNKKAEKITNQAITHFVNLETSVAVGMANAALMVDEKCGAAKLLIVNSALSGKYGSRDEQLKNPDEKKFTDQEKAWVKIMSSSEDEVNDTRKQVAAQYPKVPLFAFGASVIVEDGKDKLAEYVKAFPDYASPAYNIMSYRYIDGFYGNVDTDKALETVQKVFLTHDGPNAHDSMAEHYATTGDYKSAFEHQIKAVDYAAGGASGYGVNARIYYAHTDKVAITDTLKAKTSQRIKFQMKNDHKNLKKFYSDKVGMIGCNSNMEPCDFYATYEEEDVDYVWNRWDIKDLKVYFSPDMRTAVTTFNNDGEYKTVGSDKPIAYKTRASEVWVLEDGWKLMHSNFAPLAIGSGVPKTK